MLDLQLLIYALNRIGISSCEIKIRCNSVKHNSVNPKLSHKADFAQLKAAIQSVHLLSIVRQIKLWLYRVFILQIISGLIYKFASIIIVGEDTLRFRFY